MIKRTLLLSVHAGLAFIFAAPAVTQVPPILLDNTRRIQGDAIQICIDEDSAGAKFDRSVGHAIAAALLLEPLFKIAPAGFPINGEGYLEELEIAMNNTCDLLMGISLQSTSPFPDWGTVTRAYATVPFVLAVTDPAYRNLGDIAFDKVIGTALGSTGEWAFLGYQLAQPKDRRWKRLPYADPSLMLKRVNDGRLAGMILWQPILEQLLNDDPKAESLRVIPTDPMARPVVRVGGLVASRDTYLRNQIDLTLDALVEDGTIAELMEQSGYDGMPGG